jgi:tryptophan synthase beta subunit
MAAAPEEFEALYTKVKMDPDFGKSITMTEVNYVGRPDTALSPNVCDEIGEN